MKTKEKTTSLSPQMKLMLESIIKRSKNPKFRPAMIALLSDLCKRFPYNLHYSVTMVNLVGIDIEKSYFKDKKLRKINCNFLNILPPPIWTGSETTLIYGTLYFLANLITIVVIPGSKCKC